MHLLAERRDQDKDKPLERPHTITWLLSVYHLMVMEAGYAAPIKKTIRMEQLQSHI
jgi:hypothetical protein